MDLLCTLAPADSISAFQLMGRLIIVAQSLKPTPCHRVLIQRSPLRIFPQQYEVVACAPEGIICPEVTVPARAVGIFTVLAPDTITVNHRDGSTEVTVKRIDDPVGRSASTAEGRREQGTRVVRLNGFLESGDPAHITTEEAQRVEATGYSPSFSFEEAFNDAVANLPPDPRPYPDKLTTITVQETGAEYGGFAGLHRMFVTVATYY